MGWGRLLLVVILLSLSGCLAQPVSGPEAQNDSASFSVEGLRDVVVVNDAPVNASVRLYIQNETDRGDDFRGASELSLDRTVPGGQQYRLEGIGRIGGSYYVYAAVDVGSERTAQRIYRWHIDPGVGDLLISIDEEGEIEVFSQQV